MPARFGKAPHIPQPIEPKKNSLKNSLLNSFFDFKISLKKKGEQYYEHSKPSPKR